ncbi:glycosyltransferase family 4 protein [uncultured Polaribacter sp.]|uniref:glycosyltransferase family 4 protein n=1 Tax=uncultured Polaribacter sp. TaxID=174711 RepID=UPI00261C1EA2|nr:glycosyltransferase family 4 protein [uncultured Polaribacter sp.]
MKTNILYLLSSYNRFGGTPKKTYDLIKEVEQNNYLYVWTSAYKDEFKQSFKDICNGVFEGEYGNNLFKHVRHLIKIIDNNNIKIVQSHLFFGEIIAGLIKYFRPKVKVVFVFEGSLSPPKIRRFFLRILYQKIDLFVYISKYVKTEKIKDFPILNKKEGIVIYNGIYNFSSQIKLADKVDKTFHLLSVSSLIKIKNIDVLIEAVHILIQQKHNNIHLSITGEGLEKHNLQEKVKQYNLSKYITFLGHQKNVESLLEKTDVFLHPCYIEGFGLAVAEAMVAKRPIVASNSGALPELITNQKTGLLVDPFKAEDWATAILKLQEDKEFASQLAIKAHEKATTQFSLKVFSNNYNKVYQSL